MEVAVINQVTLQVPWEPDLTPGPVGEYLEVVDYDPASGCYYAPVDLNNPTVLAEDGWAPSEGTPQFHQQMVYAVAMTAIRNFERALGRRALWSPHFVEDERGAWKGEYVPRLRIYPHALRQANAYYSPLKKALLFGYFPADASDPAGHLPGGMVFTCLSHDVVVHETTHALLDGLHRRFIEATNPDSLAFHEAFADICALFQHFSFPEVLKHQLGKTQGDLTRQNLLGELAQQFGAATGLRGALRSAIGEVDENGQWRPLKPVAGEYLKVREPHAGEPSSWRPSSTPSCRSISRRRRLPEDRHRRQRQTARGAAPPRPGQSPGERGGQVGPARPDHEHPGTRLLPAVRPDLRRVSARADHGRFRARPRR